MNSIPEDEASATGGDKLAVGSESESQMLIPSNKVEQKETAAVQQQQEPRLEQDDHNQDNHNNANATQEEEHQMAEKDPEDKIIQVREVDPKEWRQIHDEWLHAAMRAAMGDPTLTSIPDIENVERLEQKPPAINLRLLPA